MYIERIAWNEFTFEATRSRGPGGQNVNKTNSAVILRWIPANSQSFSADEIMHLTQKLQTRLTTDGEIVIRSEESRDQDQNKKKCLEKLETILRQAFFVPKKRKPTKPTRSSQRKRIETKRHRGDIKSTRRKSWDND